jgi:uncharacterized protein YukE
MTGYIHVQFPVLEESEADLTAVRNALIDEWETMESDVMRILNWNSVAHEQFQNAKAIVAAEANKMNVSLLAGSQVVAQARDIYQTVEARNTSVWIS